MISLTGKKRDTMHVRTRLLITEYFCRLLTAIAVVTALTGYIVQFIGLRALHWSATIAQLGTTLGMTAVRAWLRKGVVSQLKAASSPSGLELPWLDLYLRSRMEGSDDNEPLDPANDVQKPSERFLRPVRRAWRAFYRICQNHSSYSSGRSSEPETLCLPFLIDLNSFGSLYMIVLTISMLSVVEVGPRFIEIQSGRG